MNLNLKLSNKQHKFLTASTRGRMFIGGIGSGKSRVLCYTAILEALKQRHCAIISFSYRNLRDVISRTMIEILDELDIDYDFNKSEMIFYINNTPILLRSSDNHDKLRGLNLDSFLLDEAREMTREVFDIMLGRLRRSKNAFWGIVSTTRAKNWFWEILRDEELLNVFSTGEASNNNVTVVLQSTLTSPFLPDEYIKDLLKNYTTNFAKQELLGQIVETDLGIINPDWFKIQMVPRPLKGIRYWDLAVSTKDSADYSASCLMSSNNGKFFINNMMRVKLSYPDLRRLIINTAIADGPNIYIGIEKAGQQMAIIDDLRRCHELTNYVIRTYSPTKDKVTRAYPFISQVELGNVILNEGTYVKDFLDECSSFSVENVLSGQYHDDQVDAAVGAYCLINSKTTANLTRLPI